jgi:LysM repeat protein
VGDAHATGRITPIESIAQKYKSKISWIMSANRISDPAKITVGKELFIPVE